MSSSSSCVVLENQLRLDRAYSTLFLQGYILVCKVQDIDEAPRWKVHLEREAERGQRDGCCESSSQNFSDVLVFWLKWLALLCPWGRYGTLAVLRETRTQLPAFPPSRSLIRRKNMSSQWKFMSKGDWWQRLAWEWLQRTDIIVLGTVVF